VSGHLLHCDIDGLYGSVGWRLECVHELGEFPTIDLDTGEHVSDECWVPECWENDGIEAITGSWPAAISFPCPVRCVWGGGLTVYYAGPVPASQTVGCPADTRGDR
jgi:hypothetical protein